MFHEQPDVVRLSLLDLQERHLVIFLHVAQFPMYTQLYSPIFGYLFNIIY